MLNPEARRARARLAAHRRWCRKRTRFSLALLWMFTLVLPPVVVVTLPMEAQSTIAGYVAAVPLSLAITWRVRDDRKRCQPDRTASAARSCSSTPLGVLTVLAALILAAWYWLRRRARRRAA